MNLARDERLRCAKGAGAGKRRPARAADAAPRPKAGASARDPGARGGEKAARKGERAARGGERGASAASAAAEARVPRPCGPAYWSKTWVPAGGVKVKSASEIGWLTFRLRSSR